MNSIPPLHFNKHIEFSIEDKVIETPQIISDPLTGSQSQDREIKSEKITSPLMEKNIKLAKSIIQQLDWNEAYGPLPLQDAIIFFLDSFIAHTKTTLNGDDVFLFSVLIDNLKNRPFDIRNIKILDAAIRVLRKKGKEEPLIDVQLEPLEKLKVLISMQIFKDSDILVQNITGVYPDSSSVSKLLFVSIFDMSHMVFGPLNRPLSSDCFRELVNVLSRIKKVVSLDTYSKTILNLFPNQAANFKDINPIDGFLKYANSFSICYNIRKNSLIKLSEKIAHEIKYPTNDSKNKIAFYLSQIGQIIKLFNKNIAEYGKYLEHFTQVLALLNTENNLKFILEDEKARHANLESERITTLLNQQIQNPTDLTTKSGFDSYRNDFQKDLISRKINKKFPEYGGNIEILLFRQCLGLFYSNSIIISVCLKHSFVFEQMLHSYSRLIEDITAPQLDEQNGDDKWLFLLDEMENKEEAPEVIKTSDKANPKKKGKPKVKTKVIPPAVPVEGIKVSESASIINTAPVREIKISESDSLLVGAKDLTQEMPAHLSSDSTENQIVLAKASLRDCEYHLGCFFNTLDLWISYRESGDTNFVKHHALSLIRSISIASEQRISADYMLVHGHVEHDHMMMARSLKLTEKELEYLETVSYGSVFTRYRPSSEEYFKASRMVLPLTFEWLSKPEILTEEKLYQFVINSFDFFKSSHGALIDLFQKKYVASDAKQITIPNSNIDINQADLKNSVKQQITDMTDKLNRLITKSKTKTDELIIEKGKSELTNKPTNKIKERIRLENQKRLAWRTVIDHLIGLTDIIESFIDYPQAKNLLIFNDRILLHLQIIAEQTRTAWHMKHNELIVRTHSLSDLQTDAEVTTDKSRTFNILEVGSGAQYPHRQLHYLKKANAVNFQPPKGITMRFNAYETSLAGDKLDQGESTVKKQRKKKNVVESTQAIELRDQLIHLIKDVIEESHALIMHE